MKLSQRFTLGLLCALSGACTEFPAIPDHGCGNHVIEGTEDCDGFSDAPGTICRKPGTSFECHWDCSVDDQGKQTSCPPGWGCDTDAVCRPPTGSFSESSFSNDVGAWSLNAGDFDGDGRQDVVSSEPLDAIGSTRLRFNYFDAHGVLTETRLFPKTILSPTFNAIDHDTISDVAFTVDQVGAMAGRPDHSWLPAIFSSYRQEDASVRIVGISDRAVDWSSAFTTLISFKDGSGFYLGNRETGALENRLPIPGSIADLVGDLVSGNLFEDPKHSPCYEPVFAMRGSTTFNVVNVCDTSEQGVITWRDTFELTKVQLAPPARIDAAPQVLDLNGDGHLDVFLGADGVPYVAYGDGVSLGVATPYVYPVEDPIFPSGTPLALGDLSGDGVLDFVFPDRILISSTAYVGATPKYFDLPNLHTARWTVAKIADFNGNGKPDVVTASSGSLNLDFYNGTGTEYLSSSLVTTSAPVQFLTTADVDGDSITDLALFEVPVTDQTRSTLKVAFGSAFAPLGTPIAVGHVNNAESLGSYRDSGRDYLTVCATEDVDSQRFGALTLLTGGPDRVPFAPMALTEFSENSSVQDAGAFAVVSGRFIDSEHTDLMALAFFRASGGPRPINVWLVPAILDPGASPKRLPGELDPRLNPVVFMPDDSVMADVASTSADLDNDGRDEAVFAMPADGGNHCGLLILGADARGSFGTARRKPVIIDEPCADPQIAAIRFDEQMPSEPGENEPPPDLALLTGKSGADDRHLYVLWNDGTGHFSSQNIVRVSAIEDSPQAFTAGALDHEHAGLAYLTKTALRLVRAPIAHAFPAPELVPGGVTVNNGTGIVAADVNGDHLTDLVFSEAGNLRVLKAELAVR